MRARVRFTLSQDDGLAAKSFANAAGKSLDEIAKYALITYINRTIKKAEELYDKAKKDGNGDGAQLHTDGTTEASDSSVNSQEL